jgi:hypothetical protein
LKVGPSGRERPILLILSSGEFKEKGEYTEEEKEKEEEESAESEAL